MKKYLENLDYKLIKANSNKLLLIFTGIAGSTSGYKGKYDIISKEMQENYNVSTMIIALPFDAWEYMQEIFDYVMNLVNDYFAKSNMEDFEIYAMGVSAGGSIVLNFANQIPNIKSLCVVNPVLTTYYQICDNKAVIDFRKMIKNLKKSSIRKTIILGEYDMSLADYEVLKEIEDVEIIVIPNGDHNLSGEENFKFFLNIPAKFLLK